MAAGPRSQVLGISPGERPDSELILALGRAGVLGVLDLGRDTDRAGQALAELDRRSKDVFGVRVPRGLTPRLPAAATTVVIDAGEKTEPFRARTVLVEVTSLDEARAAAAAGADGLIAKGCE